MAAYYGWRKYVPVAQRRGQAAREMATLRKRGVDIQPITIAGRTIARTFWGRAWCDHMESFHDFANRLPRGRTYVRNGSVCHLQIEPGRVEAKVSGSEIYDISVDITSYPTQHWTSLKKRCAGEIGTLLELLRGNLSDNVMRVVTDRGKGLFPRPKEIRFRCDCPDWASMCKHVAAVLYGVGARLDEDPSLLFLLRGVDHHELIDTDAQIAGATSQRTSGSKRLDTDDLADVFGIDLDDDADAAAARPATPAARTRTKKKTRPRKAKPAKKKATTVKAITKRPATKKAKTKKAATKPASAKRHPTAVKKKAAKKRSSLKKKTVSKGVVVKKPNLKKTANKVTTVTKTVVTRKAKKKRAAKRR